MFSGGGKMSRDPNVCASCSSMADGMLDELVQAAMLQLAQEQETAERERQQQKTENPHEITSVRISV